MNKQTAVEWLVEQLETYGSPSCLQLDWQIFDELIDQAKQMEKEQIETAIDECRHNYKHSDNYYNETYGKQKDTR